MKKHTHQDLSNLKSKWSGLCDLDRAEAIKQALDTGMSGRELAKALNCGESLIRHLKPLVEALPEEKRQARRCEISTRELKRRIIRHCDRAVPATTDDVNFIERYANWLALWAYHVMPDARVRDEALDIALDEFMARPT